jgi:hemerythrin superfamily protein
MGHTARGGLGAAAGAAAVGFIAGMAANHARKLAVQGVEAAKGDWFEVLKAEHRLVEGLFDKILATGETEKLKRTKLLLALEQALGKHALQEEDVVYPHLRMAGIETETKELASEHADIKTYLHELEELPKDDPQWLGRVREFRKLVEHHVREEENEIFPRFRDRMSPEENAKLTARMHMEGMKLA